MSEVQGNNIEGDELNQKIEKVDTSNLDEIQIQEINNSLSDDKEALSSSIKNELNDFIEKDYGEIVKKLIGKKGIIEAQMYFGDKGEKGIYSKELQQQVIKFQKKNDLKVDGILGPSTLKIMEKKEYLNIVPGAQDINEVFEKVAITVLNEYVPKINGPQGINLSKEAIYEDIISILDDTNNKLDNNIFSGDLLLFKNNFLEPKEKGIKFLEILINKKFPAKTIEVKDDEISKKDVDTIFEFTKSSIDFLFDTTKDKGPDEIKKYINELKKVEAINNIFRKFPDLEQLFTATLPEILKNTDKKQFGESLQKFYDSIGNDILRYTNDNLKQEESKNINLNIINNFSKFLGNIVNEDQVDVLTKELCNFSFIKNNEKFSSLLGLVNDSSISKSDKLSITKEIISGLDLVSRQDIKEEDINKYIKNLSTIIKQLSGKVSDEKLKEVIRKFYGLEKQGGTNKDIDMIEAAKVILESDNALELTMDGAGKVINKYANDTANGVKKYLGGLEEFWREKLDINNGNKIFDNKKIDEEKEITLEDYILEAIRSGKIDGAINEIGGEVVETLKKVVGVDLKQTLENLRNQFLSEKLVDKEGNLNPEKKDIIKKIEGDIFTKLGNKFEDSIYSLINKKINSKENNNLTKQELINLSLDNLNTFLDENVNGLIEYVKEFGFKIDQEKDIQNFKNVIQEILKNPSTRDIIGDIITNIGKDIKGKDIGEKLKQIIDKSIKEKGSNLISEKNKSEFSDVIIDTVFDNILGDKSKIESVIDLLKNNFGFSEKLDRNDTKKIILTLKNHLGKKEIKQAFKKYPKLKTFDLTSEEYIKVLKDLYIGVKNKPQFINDLLETGIVDKLKDNEKKSLDENKIDKEHVNIGVDLLYTTLESSIENNMSQSLNNIIEKYGLGELTKQNILGKNIGENIVSFLKSVDKDDLKSFLENKNYLINKLTNIDISEKEKLNIFTEFGKDILKITDVKKFQNEYKGEDLSLGEKTMLDLADEFKEVINEKEKLINNLIKKRDDIFDIYNGKIDIDNVSPEKIKEYGRELFDLLNSIVLKFDKDYLKELNIDNGKTKEKKEGKYDNIINTFLSSFKGENKWFITKGVFDGSIFKAGEALDSYFRDSENNRENFGDTMYNFLYKSTKKEDMYADNEIENGFFEE